jgi:hypothetical protein
MAWKLIERRDIVIIIHLRIRDVLDSNFGKETGYPEFLVIFHNPPPQANLGIL